MVTMTRVGFARAALVPINAVPAIGQESIVHRSRSVNEWLGSIVGGQIGDPNRESKARAIGDDAEFPKFVVLPFNDE